MDKFKTISSIGLIGLVGLIAYLFWQVDRLKDNKANQIQEINQLHWMLSAKEAETDSLKNIGEYSKPDTVWEKRPTETIDWDSSKFSISEYQSIPKVSGSIKIDTTKRFGPESNPMSIRVAGEFHYPEEYSYKNWLLIHPVMGKPPVLAKQQKIRTHAIGLRIALGMPDGAYLGLQGRFKRTSLSLSYDPWRKTALMTVGFDILRF